jgi:hypothetical protein
MKNKKKLVGLLMDQLDGDDGMAEVEVSQDANAEAVEAAEQVLKANGYTGSEEDFDDRVGDLVNEVTFIGAHWALTKTLRRKR